MKTLRGKAAPIRFGQTKDVEVPGNRNGAKIDAAILKKNFWPAFDGKAASEPVWKRIGCYVFGAKEGRKFVPWYVGKIENQKFSEECFERKHKLGNILKTLIKEIRAKPLLLRLYPKLHNDGRIFVPPKKVDGRRYVAFLEGYLIIEAKKINPNLLNTRSTKRFSKITIKDKDLAVAKPFK